MSAAQEGEDIAVGAAEFLARLSGSAKIQADVAALAAAVAVTKLPQWAAAISLFSTSEWATFQAALNAAFAANSAPNAPAATPVPANDPPAPEAPPADAPSSDDGFIYTRGGLKIPTSGGATGQ